MERGGEPSANQADHLMRPHPHGLVSLAQPFTHAPRVVASTHKKGKAHLCFVQGSVTTTAITIHRRPGLRTSRSRLESALSRECPRRLDLAAEASFQRFIDDQIPAFSSWHKGLDDQQEQLAAHCQRRPSCSVEDLMEATPVACHTVAAGTQGCSN